MSIPLTSIIDSSRAPRFLAIGGAMQLSGDSPLVRTFIKYSGSKGGVITILPTASDFGDEVGKLYLDCFSEFCHDVKYYLIESREDANNPEICERIANSTGIFFTGGNQLRITSLLGGSRLLQQIREQSNKGVIIAGTSAGASAMSRTMISWGEAERMVKGNLQMSQGIGFFDNLTIDSHFIKRGRISRLLHLVSDNPGALGIGIAEDTGILLLKDDSYPIFEVIGSRQVVVVNGRDIRHSNIAQIKEEYPYSVTNVSVSVLGPRYQYNFKTNEVFVPEIGSEKDVDPDYQKPKEITDLPFKPNE